MSLSPTQSRSPSPLPNSDAGSTPTKTDKEMDRSSAEQLESCPKLLPLQFAGCASNELNQRFPFVKFSHTGNNAWWDRDRETTEEAVERAWCVARALWGRAQSHPTSTLLMITHGLFQDLLLKVLLASTCLRPDQWCSQHPLAGNSTSGFSLAALDIDSSKSSSANAQQSESVSNQSGLPRLLTSPPVCPNSASSISQSFCRSNGDSFESNDKSFFLCNNVGISLIELAVPQTQEDNQEEAIAMESQKAFPTSLTARSSNSSNRSLCSHNQSDMLISTSDPESSSSSALSSHHDYRCAIMFWNVHSFLTGAQLASSGQSINKFSLF